MVHVSTQLILILTLQIHFYYHTGIYKSITKWKEHYKFIGKMMWQGWMFRPALLYSGSYLPDLGAFHMQR